MKRRSFIGGLAALLFGISQTEAKEQQKSVRISLPPLEKGEYIISIDEVGLVSCEPMKFDTTSLNDLKTGKKLTVYQEGCDSVLWTEEF